MEKIKTKNILITLCVLIVILIVVISCVVLKPSQQNIAPETINTTSPNIETQPKISASTSTTDLSLQTKCANEAELYFNNKVKNSEYSQDYQSHWNKQQNKCFIKITSIFPDNKFYGGGTGVELDDAIEGVYYGALDINSFGVIKVCMYGKSDGNGHGMQTCSSSEQFDSFMASLMNN